MDAFEKELLESCSRLRLFAKRHWRKVFSEDDIEDLIQETMLAALISRHTFRGEAPLSTWLISILKNKAISGFRRTSKVDLFGDDEERGEPVYREAEKSQETLLIEAEQRQLLHAALKRLSPKRQAAVMAHYFDGLSLEEAAKAAAVPINTLKTRIFYAREDLQRLLPHHLLAA
jgi:RNA polymerase sigma-70 factor (ECF subfamily)